MFVTVTCLSQSDSFKLLDLNFSGGICMLVFLFLFFLLQSLVLCCCLAAGNDLDSQLLSDREQMEFLSAWAKKHAPR